MRKLLWRLARRLFRRELEILIAFERSQAANYLERYRRNADVSPREMGALGNLSYIIRRGEHVIVEESSP